MPNKSYVKGRRKEYEIIWKARKQGKLAFRSAGSHSPIDVCIIDLKAQTIEFIQSKPASLSQRAKYNLEASLAELNNEFLCSFKVV